MEIRALGPDGMILPRQKTWEPDEMEEDEILRDFPGEVGHSLELELAPESPVGLVRTQTAPRPEFLPRAPGRCDRRAACPSCARAPCDHACGLSLSPQRPVLQHPPGVLQFSSVLTLCTRG